MEPELPPVEKEESRPPCRKVFFKAGARILLLSLLLFVPAPGLNWLAGWLYLLLYAAWSALNIALLSGRSPGLLALRETERPAPVETWDKFFVFFGGALLIGLLLVCSLEAVPSSGLTLLSAAGFLCLCAAYGLFTWALVSNRFAIGVVALQEGQVAVDKGPYGAVRHPLYLAAIVFFGCTPAALGSTGGFLPAGLLAAAVAARTALEDRLLLRSLPGYREYAARVPYRLLPGFW